MESRTINTPEPVSNTSYIIEWGPITTRHMEGFFITGLGESFLVTLGEKECSIDIVPSGDEGNDE